MWKDPIVKEVRKAGEELAKKFRFDLGDLFRDLRNKETRARVKVVPCRKTSRRRLDKDI